MRSEWFRLPNPRTREGSMRLNHPKLVHKHPAHLVSSVKMFGIVEPSPTHVKELYTPCFLCDESGYSPIVPGY